MNITKVVAISGASGAGKTTIVKQLANEFDCPFLLFDDHIDNNTYPQNMKNWLKNAADVNQIYTPKFVTALNNQLTKSRCGFIFIEEPFGKAREAMAPLIDYVVLLDQPLELCLARIIKRHTTNPSKDPTHLIANYLDKYEDHLRQIYISTVRQVRNNADLIFAEVASITDTTNYISNWLRNKAN